MRLFHPRWMALCATLIIAALIPQLLAQNGENRENIIYEDPKPAPNPRAPHLRTLFDQLTTKLLRRSGVQPRSPTETPPTAYLPYPPPPNYVWPPGPHTQSPPPSETNAPGGWYGGTGTGGQGNSGAGSAASNAGSSAAPRLQIPSLFTLPRNLLLYLFSLLPPTNSEDTDHARDRQRRGGLNPRAPIETPPTQYLPYPPPPNYNWPPGQNPGNQNPKPSEFDPPAGVYGSAGNSNQNPNPGQVAGKGDGGGWGKVHVFWVVIVAMIATGLVVGVGVWWYRGKKLGAASAPEVGEKKEKEEGGGVVEWVREWVRGWVGRFGERRKGKKEEGGGQAAAAAGEGDGG